MKRGDDVWTAWARAQLGDPEPTQPEYSTVNEIVLEAPVSRDEAVRWENNRVDYELDKNASLAPRLPYFSPGAVGDNYPPTPVGWTEASWHAWVDATNAHATGERLGKGRTAAVHRRNLPPEPDHRERDRMEKERLRQVMFGHTTSFTTYVSGW